MSISTIILGVSLVVAALLVVQALRVALHELQLKSTDLSSLWPPRYFLSSPQPQAKSLSDTAQVPHVITVQPDDPPTSRVAAPHSPVSAPHPDAETTSRVPREILQPPPDAPSDRTSQFARPAPPSDPE